MTYKEALQQVANELNLPVKVVKEAYESFWYFMRETTKTLPLMDDLTEEQFNELRPNFNIPSLGKLGVTYKRYTGVKKRFQVLKERKNERLAREASSRS